MLYKSKSIVGHFRFQIFARKGSYIMNQNERYAKKPDRSAEIESFIKKNPDKLKVYDKDPEIKLDIAWDRELKMFVRTGTKGGNKSTSLGAEIYEMQKMLMRKLEDDKS